MILSVDPSRALQSSLDQLLNSRESPNTRIRYRFFNDLLGELSGMPLPRRCWTPPIRQSATETPVSVHVPVPEYAGQTRNDRNDRGPDPLPVKGDCDSGTRVEVAVHMP